MLEVLDRGAFAQEFGLSQPLADHHHRAGGARRN
jgi:hypothetical protein